MPTLDDFMTPSPNMYPAHSEKYGQVKINVGNGVMLPGHGSPGSDCGNNIPMHCNNCGETYTVTSSCMKRECPNCYEKWASLEGKLSAYRLWMASTSIVRGRPYKRGWRVLHCVVSLPTGDDNTRDRARLISRKHGLRGGLMVWHPFRHDDEKHYVPDGYDHYHVVGLAYGDIKPGGIPEDGDAVFKVIKDARRNDYRGFQAMKEVRKCIQYLLSHCGIQKGRHPLTWWGCMSYNSLSNKTLDVEFPEVMHKAREFKRRCPVCGSDDVEPIYCMDYTSYPGDKVLIGVNYLRS